MFTFSIFLLVVGSGNFLSCYVFIDLLYVGIHTQNRRDKRGMWILSNFEFNFLLYAPVCALRR